MNSTVTMDLSTLLIDTATMNTATMDTATMNTVTVDTATMDTATIDTVTVNTATMDTATMDTVTVNTATMDTATMDTEIVNSVTMDSVTMDTATMDASLDMSSTMNMLTDMMSTMDTATIDPCSLITMANNSCGNGTELLTTRASAGQPPADNQETILYAVTTVIIGIGMIGIGATVHYKTLWGYIKKPKAYVLGVLMQLILLPLLAWALIRIFSMPFGEALGVFIQGCSPGGTTSNLVVYWLDGIVDLSVAMTVTTTLLALGTMPLWLFIYSKGDNLPPEYQVPYDTLAISLVVLIVPLFLGMFMHVKFPKYAERLSKVFIISASIMILIMIVVRSLITRIPWIVTWRQGVVAAIMPLIAFILGYVVTLIPRLRLDGKRKRTISIETALQNVQVAAAVIQISFGSKPRLLVQMLLFPLLYYLFQVGYSAIFSILYIIAKKKGWIALDEKESDDNPENGNIPISSIERRGKENPGFEGDAEAATKQTYLD